jgi:prolyl-tRNA synthetase
MLRIKDRHERDLLYGPTNEEVITDIARQGIRSYRELPQTLYHIQWKFRDEMRPRFGVMRGREFLMKDAYSFDLDYAGAVQSYRRMMLAYMRTFQRLGVAAIPMVADTGPIGGRRVRARCFMIARLRALIIRRQIFRIAMRRICSGFST